MQIFPSYAETAASDTRWTRLWSATAKSARGCSTTIAQCAGSSTTAVTCTESTCTVGTVWWSRTSGWNPQRQRTRIDRKSQQTPFSVPVEATSRRRDTRRRRTRLSNFTRKSPVFVLLCDLRIIRVASDPDCNVVKRQLTRGLLPFLVTQPFHQLPLIGQFANDSDRG